MSTLREAVNGIRQGRLGALSVGYYKNQTELSSVLPRLALLEARVDKPTRSRLETVAEKVSLCLKVRSCSTLERADWRIVPWVMWSGDSPAADQDWFLEELFQIIAANRPKSVIRALVHAYVYYFDQTRSSFSSVGNFLTGVALKPGDRLSDKWLEINMRCRLFEPSRAGYQMSSLLLQADDVMSGFEGLGISREQVDGGLAQAAFTHGYEAVARALAKPRSESDLTRALKVIFTWGDGAAGDFRYRTLLTPMGTALLEALSSSPASLDVQDQIVHYFVQKLGDPRLNRARWLDISQTAFDTAMRILVRATLEDFTRVIDATADARHWRERKPFWLKYYELGVIEDAWVAFGPKAVSKAHRLDKSYGLLEGASETAHSALILRIRDLVIVEWSHNGRCRFFPRSGGWVPESYAKRYNFRELHRRSDESGDYLSHMNNWQLKFANRIFRETNVRHPKFGIGAP